MEFKFGQREYQVNAINSVVDLFKGQPTADRSLDVSYSEDVKDNNINYLAITDEKLLKNLQKVQDNNNRKEAPIQKADSLKEKDYAIEMETGTGKTFVYFSTIAHLAREYDWKKFIIVVPTIAIKEGVETEFRRLKKILEDIADTTINLTVYNGDKIDELADYYSQPLCVEILLMTMGSFNKNINVLNRDNPDSKAGQKPVDLLAKTNPIMILDEPQKMSGEATTRKLKNFNPLMTLRYSATHKVTDDSNFKFIYRYTPLDAYRDRYVKKIEVMSVYDSYRNPAKAFVEVKSIDSGKNLTARVAYFENTATGIKEKTKKVKQGDNLYELSNEMPEYNNYLITRISTSNNEVTFKNGLVVKLDEVTQNKDEIMQIQIKETIRTHLEKEKDLNSKGIKVLTLFFIDKVINYRNPNDEYGKGKIRKWFEESYEDITAEEEFKEFQVESVDEVQLAYFSVDKKGSLKDTREKGQSQADFSTYDKIMRQKELLVSFEEPGRFIFSHSALREGWDNPNVFQICNLNETTNEVRRRQEVGRGLRLPVNQDGDRIMDDDINILTIASSISYELFAKSLQEEITAETGIKTSGVITSNKAKRKKSYLKKENFENEAFENLWKLINRKLTYNIVVDEDILIRDIVKKIKDSNFKVEPITYKIKRTVMKDIYNATTRKEIVDTREIEKINIDRIPNIIKRIADFTGLTKKVVIKIIQIANIQHHIFIQPDTFVELLTMIISEELPRILKEGIVYHASGERYEQTLFNDYIQVYEDKDNPLIASGLDLDRTFYDVIQLDSETEVTLINEMNADKNRFKFFIKLPANFKVPTPAGNYNPDWAFVFGEKEEPEVYLVRESKKTNDRMFSRDKLRVNEIHKIEYGKKAFNSIDVDYQVVQVVEDIKPNGGVFNFENNEINFEDIPSEKGISENLITTIKTIKSVNPTLNYAAAKATLGNLLDTIAEEQFDLI